MTAPDPVTAHGWAATRASSSLVTTNRLSYLVVAPTRLCGDDEGPPDEAFAGLISCVEDAATLAEARTLAAEWLTFFGDCPYCDTPEPSHPTRFIHVDDCPVGKLLALLTGGTP